MKNKKVLALLVSLVLIVAVYIDQVRQMRAPKKAHVS